jgi:hypothetical protein
MEVGVHGGDVPHAQSKRCSRAGCDNPVKKRTNKYCSVRCCSIDPERIERLRSQAQRAHRTVVPMTRQLSLELWGARLSNPEAELDVLGEGREDVPRGMSHLAV